MTVQELIQRLEKIEDKNRSVVVSGCQQCFHHIQNEPLEEGNWWKEQIVVLEVIL
jgi:ribosomal 30S subunit maturation factor RimM